MSVAQQTLSNQSARRQPGLSDLLSWLVSPYPGVVICKDGALLAGYYFQGRDLTTLSGQERNRVAETFSKAIRELSGGWSLHVDATRVAVAPYGTSQGWPDRISQRIDEERRSQFDAEGAMFETIQALVLRWKPPTVMQRRFLTWLFDRERDGVTQDVEDCLAKFEEALSSFEDKLVQTLRLERMALLAHGESQSMDQLRTHLRWSLTGEQISLSPRLPQMHLDTQMACHELKCGAQPSLGDEWLGVVGLEDLPDATVPDLLQTLQALPFAARWSTRFVCLDEVEARRELKAVRVKWAQQTRGWLDKLAHPQPTASSVINQDASLMRDEAEAQLSTLSSGQLGFGYLTTVVVVRHADLESLQNQMRSIRQLLQHFGFAARLETINTVEAFLGSLPGHVHENVRSHLIDTRTLANLLPLSSTWTGHSKCPSSLIEGGRGAPLLLCRTEESTPFRFNLHIGDLGHTLLFGATRSGKSTLIALLCAQWLRYQDARVVAIDKDRSLETLTHALGGAHHVLDPTGSTHQFAPFAHIDDPAERAWAVEWIEDLCRVQGLNVTQEQRKEITRGIAAQAHIRGQRKLSDICVAIQDEAVKNALEPYAAGGAYGHLFGGERDSLDFSQVMCVELAAVIASSDKLRIPCLSYLFRIVERQADGRPMLLTIDEAWAALGDELFRERLREWLKTMAKKNVVVLLATQTLSDVTRSGMVDVLAESCPTRIFGANAEAHQSPKVYQELGAGPAEVELIAQLQPKRQYFVMSRGEGARVVDFHLGTTALAFCGISSKADLARLEVLRAEHPKDWQEKWMKEVSAR